jgi:hypothetical protein
MAGDEVRISDAGVVMIHDASTVTYGNGADHRETADLLDKLSDVIATVYANKAGEDMEFWRALMSAPGGNGTWYTGQEAYDAGLVDAVERSDTQDGALLSDALAAMRLRAPEKVTALANLQRALETAPTVTEKIITENVKAQGAAPDQSQAWALLASLYR